MEFLWNQKILKMDFEKKKNAPKSCNFGREF